MHHRIVQENSDLDCDSQLGANQCNIKLSSPQHDSDWSTISGSEVNFYAEDEYRSSQDNGSDLSSLVPDSSCTWETDGDDTYRPPSSSPASTMSSIIMGSSHATNKSSDGSLLTITISSASSPVTRSIPPVDPQLHVRLDSLQSPNDNGMRLIPFSSPSPEITVNILEDSSQDQEPLGESTLIAKRPRLAARDLNDSAIGKVSFLSRLMHIYIYIYIVCIYNHVSYVYEIF